ncbi:TnsA-like heteromeric transposase endonuclease subunit [Isoptericola cucumis]|uniref:TnsA-like heteromeric transposase endonuclease subunit n=1 Tax=Isoptericola cucumis TaxID=1776856 RepID=UPI0032088D2F
MSSARPECAPGAASVNQKVSDFKASQPASWRVRTTAGDDIEWDWSLGALSIRFLLPARRTVADSMSRHAPVRMHCQTTGSSLVLESGLEYELARELDRDPSVAWIVAQPMLITFADGTRHVPDIACEHADGRVVVWDARPSDRRDEGFMRQARLTEEACTDVGWEYALYDSAEDARRLNMLWLACFRHQPAWPHHAARMRLQKAGRRSATVGELMALDAGDGQTTATMWHLLWTGSLTVDLDARITADTAVRLRGGPR